MIQVERFRSSFFGLPRQARFAVLGVGVLTLIILFMITRAATSTDWVAVQSSMKPEDAGPVQAALEDKGIQNKVEGSGTSVVVPKESLSDARVALATAGVLKGASSDVYASILDSKKTLGQTREQERLMKQRLLESLIAGDLEKIEGIDEASVRLVMPERTALGEDESEPTASVTLNTNGEGVDKARARAVASLTANSVPDLKPGAVVITDEQGNSMGGNEEGESGSFSAGEAKIQVEDRFNAKMTDDLTRKLEEITGVGKVRVLYRADLNMDKITREAVDVGGEDNARGPVTERSNKIERFEGAGTQPGGVTGTAGNQQDPTYQAQNQGSQERAYRNEDINETYSADTVKEMIAVAPGNTEAHHTAVVMDSSLPVETRQAVENAVRGVIGTDADNTWSFDDAKLAVSAPDPDAEKAATIANQVTKYGKWVAVGLGLLLLALFMRKSLNQRTAELMTPMQELLLLETGDGPISLNQLEAANSTPGGLENQQRQQLQQRVELLAKNQPTDVAAQLRGWLHEAEYR